MELIFCGKRVARAVPACPEEKVKAIEEALKYFGIIK